jgi:TonB family protein
MAVRWQTMDAATAEAERKRIRNVPAPAPPPPPRFFGSRLWPRFDQEDRVVPISLPAIQVDYPKPAGRPGEGMVSLDLIVSAAAGISGCEIGIGSGNPALDEAACRVARRLDLRYIRPCFSCADTRLPLQVVWRKRGSHIRLPLPSPYAARDRTILRDPADTRIATTYSNRPQGLGPALATADFARLADRTHSSSHVRVDLSIDGDGRTSACRVLASSGNPAIDRRTCDLLVKRARFQPPTDIFGDPRPSTQTLWINLSMIR